MDTTEKKVGPETGNTDGNREMLAAHDEEKQISAYVSDAADKEKIEAAREVAESEITEPAFVNPVSRHRGYTAVVLAVLGLCAAFLIADLFYYGYHKDKVEESSNYTTTMTKQQTKTVELPGLTVVDHGK